MKIFRYILLASLTCTLFSCGPDELIPESVPPVVNPGDKDEPGEEPEEPEKIQLAITASLQDMQQTRGIIEAFAPGHEMGVFISTDRTAEAGTSSKAEIYWRERFSEVRKSGICPGSGICGNCGKMGVSRVQYVENSGIFRGSRSAGRMDHK